MSYMRSTYDSEQSALRRIAEGGGLVPLWRKGMEDADIPEGDDAREGDVGIILREVIETIPGEDDGYNEDGSRTGNGPTAVVQMMEVCGIFTGERWATLGLRGMDFGPAEPLIIWRP